MIIIGYAMLTLSVASFGMGIVETMKSTTQKVAWRDGLPLLLEAGMISLSLSLIQGLWNGVIS